MQNFPKSRKLKVVIILHKVIFKVIVTRIKNQITRVKNEKMTKLSIKGQTVLLG